MVNGTLIWYYYICPREVWLLSRQLEADQEHTDVAIGRYLHEQVYAKEKKELDLGHIKLDVLRKEQGKLVIGEVKKSSKFEKSAEMQLLFYLYELKSIGVEAVGELLFPEEKRKKRIELTPEAEAELEKTIVDIEKIIQRKLPPKAVQSPYCKRCAYQEFCWA